MGIYLDGNNWFIDFYFDGKRRREMVGPNKKLAELAFQKRRVQIAEQKFFDIKPEEQSIRFKDFSLMYMERYSKPNKKSWKTSDAFSTKHLLDYFGEKKLSDIKPLMVLDYKMKRSEIVSVSTVNRELACLKCMYNRAIDWELAKENPVRKVEFFKENNKRTRYLEKEEITQLLNHCSDRLKAVILFAINTGMRKGEIQNLKWSDIDFNNGIMTLSETKNGETRYVPINTQVREILQSLERHPNSDVVFCDLDTGKSYNFRKAFETALRHANITNFKFHDLRHTFASHLVMSGVDLNTVRELLGHKSLAMTLRYSHLSHDHKKKAVEVLSTRIDSIQSPTGPAEVVA